MSQHREDPQGDPLPEPHPTDDAPEPADRETVRDDAAGDTTRQEAVRNEPIGDAAAQEAVRNERVPGTPGGVPDTVDLAAEGAAPVERTLRSGQPDPAVVPVPAAPIADVGPADVSAATGEGATVLGGAADPGTPTVPGVQGPADPAAGSTQPPTASDGGPAAGPGTAGPGPAEPSGLGGPGSSGGPGGPGEPSGPAGGGGPGGAWPGAGGGGAGGAWPGGGGAGGAWAGGGAGGGGPAGGSFKRLTRQQEGRVVAGVAGGLARYLNVDPVILRIAFLGLTLLGGLGLVLYLLAWFMIPVRAGVDSPGEGLARRLAGAPPWIRVTLLVVGTLIALEAVGPVSTILIVGLLIGLGVSASNSSRANGGGAAADRS